MQLFFSALSTTFYFSDRGIKPLLIKEVTTLQCQKPKPLTLRKIKYIKLKALSKKEIIKIKNKGIEEYYPQSLFSKPFQA